MPDLPTGWTETSLGEVIELKRGYDLPKRLREEGDVPIISSSGLSGSHNASKVTGPGVVTGRYGTIGEVHWVDEDYWPLNTALYMRDFKGNDRKFIYYLLPAIDYFSYSDKAAVPGVNRNHLHKAEVLLPPLPEQRAIASILGALDDKIELNRRMNATLESLARAIFKSWFVDFDPVKINAGQMPASSQALATHDPKVLDLFPSTFQDSELGPIPEGWDVVPLGAIFELKRGYDLPERKRIDGRFPVYSSGGFSGTHNEPKVAAPLVVTGRYGTIGNVFYVDEDAWPLNTTLYVRDFKGNSERYVFYLLKRVNFHAYTDKAAVPGINRNHVH